MPGFDGTGPAGMGPMTGGGRGWCSPYGHAYTGYGPYRAPLHTSGAADLQEPSSRLRLRSPALGAGPRFFRGTRTRLGSRSRPWTMVVALVSAAH